MTSSTSTSNSEKVLIANLMKHEKLNKRQQKWVKNQLKDHKSTILVDLIFFAAAIVIWFVVVWVAVGL